MATREKNFIACLGKSKISFHRREVIDKNPVTRNELQKWEKTEVQYEKEKNLHAHRSVVARVEETRLKISG